MAGKKKREGEEKFESIKGRVGPIKREKIEEIVKIGEKKRIDFVRESEKRFPLSRAVLLFFAVAVAGGVLIFMTPCMPSKTSSVNEGDVAQIGYKVMFQNGSVFDAGNYTFVVGSGEVLKGMDRAVTGMIIGERKVVTLSPEEAYGNYEPNKTQVISLVQKFNRTANMTKELFKLTFDEDPIVNRLYRIRGMEWSIRVIDIKNETVVYVQELQDGMVFDLKDIIGKVYGKTLVSVDGEKIKLTHSPVKGSVVTTVTGEGRVTEANETHMVIDFNHPLAGETLILEIMLVDFNPR